jgi:hypothetical protein
MSRRRRTALSRHPAPIFFIVAVMLLAGCTVRSISDAGYPDGHNRNPFYRGELTEFDLLGDAEASDAEIARRLAAHKRLSLATGSNIMLIQSGAPLPDDAMTQALSSSFGVTPFSGVPPAVYLIGAPSDAHRSYLRLLRTEAAAGGASTILCYWGVIETARQGEATKAVSWVPIVGSVIPDETQRMRIRIKMLLVDVATGDWASLAPPPADGASLSASIDRAGADQTQVAHLKDAAYRAAAEAVVQIYSP